MKHSLPFYIDPNTASNYFQVKINHIHLDLRPYFESHTIEASAIYDLHFTEQWHSQLSSQASSTSSKKAIIFDTRDLIIKKIEDIDLSSIVDVSLINSSNSICNFFLSLV